jgi:septal ring factor EnvC (AmiA/AmiB activator)
MKTPNHHDALRPLVALSMLAAAVCFTGRSAMARRPDKEIDKITAAIDALDSAHKELHDAADDFHGHKKAAMEKIETARKVLEDSRDAHVDKASDKITEAMDELDACVKGDHEGDHPKIHAARKALEAAKEQL